MNANWFSDQEFWALFYDWMFPAKSFAQAMEQVEDLIRLTDCAQGRVLDLCCGPGRHSVALVKRGFNVTAVDLQTGLLDKARDYAARENVAVEFLEADMRRFRRADTFDLAISMFSSFGYFSDPTDDQRVLENIWHSLKTEGRILLDVRGKEIHAMVHADTYSCEMPNGDLIVHRTRINDDWTSTRTTWLYIDGERARRFDVIYNLYSGAELRSLLSNAGFDNVAVYGDLKGIPYNDKATRLIAVADKPRGGIDSS